MITYHRHLDQGSGDWYAARCGLLTASEMKLIITPTLKVASNEKERQHLFELLGQRITKYVEPAFVGYDMLRGQEEEIAARATYAQHYAPVEECGFVTNDKWGFTIGYSPDALVGDDGLIECKSRRMKYQIETICTGMPSDFLIQVQTGLLVTERSWLDFVSYSGGLPMFVLRVYPDEKVQAAIVSAAADFEQRLADRWADYDHVVAAGKFVETERTVELDISV